MTTISALLLPLGIWLILSAATPKTDENRVAVSGMLTALVAALAFSTSGFAFMAPGGLSLPISGQPWEVLGNTGFLMGGATASLTRFVPQLALALACALLVNSVMVRRTHFLVQSSVSAVVGGVLFPIAGKWVLGGGWLAALGRRLNFGHGAVDFGGLATTALVAGVAGLALVWVLPRRQPRPNVGLPLAQFPFRAISGMACALIGAVIVFGSNPFLGETSGDVANKVTFSYFIVLSVACIVAALCGLLYSRVTSSQADSLCAARAMLAAVIMVSSGAGTLPVWVAAALGIVAGLLATVGLYIVHEKLHLDDDSALITNALLPGVIGFLVTGLFANGSLGAGWNGVGDSIYLTVPKLGVVGLLPVAAAMGDAGQLTAQFIAIGSIGVVSLLGAGVMAYALRPVLQLPLAQPIVQSPVLEPAFSAPTPPIATAAMQWSEAILLEAPARAIEIQPIPAATMPIPAPEPVTTYTAEAEVTATPTAQSEPEVNRVFVTATNVSDTSDKKKGEDGLLDRLRRLRRANLPEQPARARKVAYPTRVNGKRLIRPLVDETSAKP